MGGKGSGPRPGSRNAGRRGNPLEQAQDCANVDRETNHRALALARAVYELPPIDLADEAAVEARLFEYLDLCDRHGCRPLVSGLANAYGITRNQLTSVGRGDKHILCTKLTDKSRSAIEKSYNLFEQIWESELSDEKGNPVKWIFLAKNNFGYRDQTEQVVTRREEKPALTSPDEVNKKYAELVGREPMELPESAVVVEPVESGSDFRGQEKSPRNDGSEGFSDDPVIGKTNN